MEDTILRDLTDEEAEIVSGGMTGLQCAAAGGLFIVAVAMANPFGAAASLLGAWAGGCFD